MADVGVLGCGWLGLPLAAEWVRQGYSVNGSTTSFEKRALLEASGITPFLIEGNADGFSGELAKFLDVRMLIITLPPKKGHYRDTIPTLISHIKKTEIRLLVFCSSISVYGKTAGIVTEETPTRPDNDLARDILEAERLFRDNLPQTTTLRFGGLTGPGRHPVTHLAGRQDVPEGDAPINLVHLEDCIGAINTVLKHRLWGKVYNIVPPFHPSKKEYYRQKACERGLVPPTFVPGGGDQRIVDGSLIGRDSGFAYQVVESL